MLKLVKVPMKLLVAVETLGSIFSDNKIGPINKPPAIPNEPASIPAIKTTILYCK